MLFAKRRRLRLLMVLTWLLLRQTQLVQHKGKVKRQFLEIFVAVRRTKVPRSHVHLHADGTRRRILFVSERGRKLGRLPILYARIVETSRQQAGRILAALEHCLHWTVLFHVLKILFLAVLGRIYREGQDTSENMKKPLLDISSHKCDTKLLTLDYPILPIRLQSKGLQRPPLCKQRLRMALREWPP